MKINAFNVCVIPGFRRGVNEVFALLGCYAALTGIYRRFETANWSHLQGSAALPLNMAPIDCIETSVTDCQSTLRKIPQDRRPHTFNDLDFLSSQVKEVSQLSYEETEVAVTDIYTRQ